MPVSTNALICENIHQTTTGQFILVGAVTGILQTNSDSYSELYSLFVQFSGLPKGNYRILIRLTSPDKNRSGTVADTVVSDERTGATLVLSGIPFITKASGTFKVDWRLEDATKWLPLAKFEIDLNVQLPSNHNDSDEG